jgi:hypothetical protein
LKSSEDITRVQLAKAALFPLDEQLEIGGVVWSEGVICEAVWLSGAIPSYAMVEEVLRRIGGIEVSRTTIWRCTQEAGKKFCQLEVVERERATALPEQWTPPSRARVADQRMGVAMDGALINIRQEGWKEVKIGTVFELAVSPTPDPTTGEMIEYAHAAHNSYVAHLGGPDVIGEMTWVEARRRGWEQAQDTQVVADGAGWIWNQAALHFGDSHQVVDWYHAMQHLMAAAHLLKKESSSALARWLNNRTTLLYQGHAQRIATELAQAASSQAAEDLATEAVFFRNHHLRMNYLEMREGNWLIGSGTVECAAKQFKARFAGPGMRWSRKGAENLLPIRAAVLSNRFHDCWAAAKNLPPL